MDPRPRLTLGRAFALAMVSVAVLLGILFYFVFQDSRESILESAEAQRQLKSEAIADTVQLELVKVQRTLEGVEARLGSGALRADDLLALEAELFGEVLTNPQLAEVTFTRGTRTDYDGQGYARLAPDGRWQLSVSRVPEGSHNRLLTRLDHRDGGHFVCDLRDRAVDAGFGEAPLRRQSDRGVEDPTEHLTFRSAARQGNEGKLLWSDLHYSQLDEALPKDRRRVILTAQKAIADRQGRLLGVLRVGSLTRQIDELVQLPPPETAFLCDSGPDGPEATRRERLPGRLISRREPSDMLVEIDEDLRVSSRDAPAAVQAALALPLLAEVSRTRPEASGELSLAGRKHLVTFRALPDSQGWIVGIVVPEDAYLEHLVARRDRLLLISLGLSSLILFVGILALRAVRGSLAQLVDVAARMRGFDFAASNLHAPFADVQEVMQRLDSAKTAMRALGKYVPISLVRILYQSNREPVLGGELQQVSLMFTDIKDFTTLAERLPPNELARALGRYLEVMTAQVHQTQGIIDKYIGDAVMAIWNVPTPVAEHPRRACEAAIGCQEACARLFESGEWAGLPPFHTRFGLHTDEVMVGHFGAPDRMSYTALGDGVNLASRLEALNKQYGSSVLVSEATSLQAGDGFVFRLLDAVAVKGKAKGVRVYELVGRAGEHAAREAQLRSYEQALAAYWRREFAAALLLLEPQLASDPPSLALAERCRGFLLHPPPAEWDGTYISTTK